MKILYIKAKMVSIRMSVRPGADLGFGTSTDGQDQVLKSRSLDGRGGRRRRMAAANMVSVRLSGQKLGSAWKILPVTARSTCSCDLIVQHVHTQSLASMISAKHLMVMIVVMGSSAVPAAAQERSLPSPLPFQPASNSERSISAGRSFAGVPAFLLHCKNLCVLFSPATFFLSCYPFCPQITTRDR